MSDVFISYASENRDQARQLATALVSHGWSVWWDRQIPFGKSFDQVIEQQIASARCMIVLWSRRSVESDWVKNEAREGQARQILVPALIEPTRIPLGFRHAQTADLTDWQAGAPHAQFDQLLDQLRALLGERGSGSPPDRAIRAPEPPAAKARTAKPRTAAFPVWLGALGIAVAIVAVLGARTWYARSNRSPDPAAGLLPAATNQPMTSPTPVAPSPPTVPPMSVLMEYSGRAVGPNQDGRLELAFTSPNGTTFHLWQTAPSAAWVADAAAFPGTARAASFPAIVRRLDGRLDVFIVTAIGTVAHSRQAAPNVNWEPWVDLGGALQAAGGAAVTIEPAGGVFVAARGKDGAVWYNREAAGGSFTGWKSLGGKFAGAPAVALNADGRLELFAVSDDGQLSHSWQTQNSDTFSSWVSMGDGPFVGSPSAARNLDQRLEVFVSTAEGGLAHAWQTAPNGGWSAFDRPPGTHVYDPTVVMNVDGTLDVFVVGAKDKAVWHRRQVAPNNGWGDWTSLGGVVSSTPAVGRNADGTLVVLAVGQDGSIWETRQRAPGGPTWTSWARVGGQVQPDLF